MSYTFTIHLVKMEDGNPVDEQIAQCSDIMDQGRKFLKAQNDLRRKGYTLEPTVGAERHFHCYNKNGRLTYLLFTNN